MWKQTPSRIGGFLPKMRWLGTSSETQRRKDRKGKIVFDTPSDSYCSRLYAFHDVAIHTDSKKINQTQLNCPFPESYKPTWHEKFDSIARQTKSSWEYDPKRDYWVFTPSPMPVPFDITLEKGWTKEDRGLYVSYRPPSAPVGMDIYMMGTYSFSEEEKDSFVKVKEDIALLFAKSFQKDITAKEMSAAKVGQYDALHFKISAPQTGIVWRQWIMVESGKAIAIVSAIKPEDEKKILPDVEKMLKSFVLKTAKEGNKENSKQATRKGAPDR